MRYKRNKGGAYAMGFGLLGLLVTVGIMLYLWSLTAQTSVNSYKSSKEALDAIHELGVQRSEETFQANRDPRAAADANAANSASNDPAPAPARNAAPSATPPLKKITDSIPRQMPDHGAGKLIEEME